MHAESALVALLVQLVVILAATAACRFVARKLGQVDVIGEVAAGLLLGPTLFGALAPELSARVFPTTGGGGFAALASLGLVLLMFQLGLDFELGGEAKSARRSVPVISIVGVVLPFAGGFFVAPVFHATFAEPRPDLLSFQLFFGIGMSITAIPVLGRIFLELGLMRTTVASITMAAAAIDDLIGWLLLGAVALVVGGAFAWDVVAQQVGGILVYLLIVFFVAGPLLRRLLRRLMKREGHLRHRAIGISLAVLFVSAAATSTLGLHALIGGFALGAALSREKQFVADWKARVAPLVNTLFLPLFFTATGLRTDVGTLNEPRELLLLLVVFVVAIGGKLGGCYVAARLTGEPHRRALVIGLAMNTRGLMELVALNIGYELGILPQSCFTMLVLMALGTTAMTTPLVRRLAREEAQAAPHARTAVTLELEGAGEHARRAMRPVLEGALGDRRHVDEAWAALDHLVDVGVALCEAANAPSPDVALRIDGRATRVVVRCHLGPKAARAAAALTGRSAPTADDGAAAARPAFAALRAAGVAVHTTEGDGTVELVLDVAAA